MRSVRPHPKLPLLDLHVVGIYNGEHCAVHVLVFLGIEIGTAGKDEANLVCRRFWIGLHLGPIAQHAVVGHHHINLSHSII